MKREFERYRLGSQHVMVGTLQIAASLGLLAGLSQPWMVETTSARLLAAGFPSARMLIIKELQSALPSADFPTPTMA